jgi:hypothetical protein
MPRTALTPVALVANSSVTASSVALDATNSHVFTPSTALDEFFLLVSHTTASTKTVTVKAGDSPPADAAGQGDLVVSFGAGNVTAVVKLIGPLSSSRFIQNDGTVNVDVEAGATGTVTVYRVPRNA